jgi:hypothetical protein
MQIAYDRPMCSCEEWEKFLRRFEHTVEERQVRDLVADAAARIDALIECVMAAACVPEEADRDRAHRSGSQREWIV